MSKNTPLSASSNNEDMCTICLSALAVGTPILTLSCNHKFHLQCLAQNVQAQNKECPLCRDSLDPSIIQLLSGAHRPSILQLQRIPPNLFELQRQILSVVQSTEDLLDEVATRDLLNRLAAARQAALASASTQHGHTMVNVSTTLEYGACVPDNESNIYALVTLQAEQCFAPVAVGSLNLSRVPIDLVCVVDQSGSMSGEKMNLLKETLNYIIEQLNDFDRLAIVSFDTEAYDQSHGLKRMTQENRNILKNTIRNSLGDGGGTYIGRGLEMGINHLRNRQTKNPISALLLLTDGQDNEQHNYTELMQTLPEGVQCHTFGYGPDHTASLLVQITEQGNGGTFSYIDLEAAVGPAFAMTLGGLFTCIAQQVQVSIELNDGYTITHAHSRYKYEPAQLPSREITFKLNDLNAEEKRNLLFQIHVPKLSHNQENANITNTQQMTQSQQTEDAQLFENHSIGNVKITYTDPNTSQTVRTDPVPFQLVRSPNPSAELLKVNYTLDIQRNRVETTYALQQAMAEPDYQRSLMILRAQVAKIRASPSARDPFCRQLIQDLRRRYPTEGDYRLSNHSTYMSHTTERGAYTPSSTISTARYNSFAQRNQLMDFYSSHIKE